LQRARPHVHRLPALAIINGSKSTLLARVGYYNHHVSMPSIVYVFVFAQLIVFPAPLVTVIINPYFVFCFVQDQRGEQRWTWRCLVKLK